MKNLVRIITLSLVFCGIPDLKAQMVTYSGPVEYSMKVIKTATGGGTDGGYDWNVMVNESRIITGSFYVTFTGGSAGIPGVSNFMLTSVKENIDFTNTVNNEGNEQVRSQICKDGNTGESFKVSPGDSRRRSTTIASSRLETEKPVITGGQLMIKGDEYTFLLFGEMKMEVTYVSLSEETFPCKGSSDPPTSISNSSTFTFPIVINAKKELVNPKYMEGTYILENTSSDKCNEVLPGGIARMAHGDMTCSSISDIRTSWILVKRAKECNGNVSYLKGDVKINGVPAEEGSISIAEGDVIETGPRSRIQLRMSDGSTYRMGSKSKLTMINPCPSTEDKTISATFLKGKLYSVLNKHFGANTINTKIRSTGGGVRGQANSLPVYFASADPDFVPRSITKPKNSLYPHSFQQEDPEKAELIEGYQSLTDDQAAYYLDFEDGVVKDITALRGTLHIKDEMGFRSMDIPEGTTVNMWQDGTQMTEIFISIK